MRKQMKFGAQRVAVIASLITVITLFSACGEKSSTFSLLSDANTFQQNAAAVNSKIDVLFVVDNSGSMDSSQTNLTANFQRFIDKFDQKGFDYRLAVTTTDAYKDLFGAPTTQSRFRDGTDATSHTGIYLITPTTPNRDNVFLVNAKQGISGSGDERAFQSMKETLNNPFNAGFPRADAFLAVIIISDEDDFSHDTVGSMSGDYANPDLHTVDSYVSYLDQITNATELNRSSHYNVSSIAALDTTCLDYLNSTITGRQIGQRYIDISNKTSGVVGSICGDFGTSLTNISTKIIELTTQFYLNRIPNVNTIAVTVAGRSVPRVTDSTPQPWNGFSYNSVSNSITFHGTGVPGPGEAITVNFDPLTLK